MLQLHLSHSDQQIYIAHLGVTYIRGLAIYVRLTLYFNRQYGHLYHNYEKYPLSPLKPGSLAFIEQYLPNISDTVYSVH